MINMITWEDELKKYLANKLEVDVSALEFVELEPPRHTIPEMTIQGLGQLYAFSITKEDYELANEVKIELEKRKCKISFNIDEKNKVGTIDITSKSKAKKNQVNIYMKTLNNGLWCIDFDKENF